MKEADHRLGVGPLGAPRNDLADVVDADAREAQPEEAHRQEDELYSKHLHAAQAVPPREPEQPADQLRVGGPCFGAGRLWTPIWASR